VGLKEGILEEVVDKYFHVWDVAGEAENVIHACVRLGQRYQFDEPHGTRVSEHAAKLFDDLQAVHAFNERDRLLLRAAAVLHDIGDFVRYDGHHKHSYYLIQHADIMGLTPDERAIVANIARYHRKSLPDPSHPNFRELDRDARGKVRGLAAILRIADALDREHRGKVTAVRAVVERSKGQVLLFLRGDSERELEEWTVHAKAELLRDVYDLDVVIADGED
jgi:exopolyphosphatase/guanosine-5'-triphosphate,3'-diphosphate pyrophosphatase